MPGTPLILGHRGAPLRATENTLPALLAACEEGDGVELDVQVSRDGALVLFHDTTIGGRGVHTLDRAELAAALGHRVDTLDEVIEALPKGAWACLEFKRQGSTAEVDAHRAMTALARRRDPARTWVASFDPWFLRACAAVAPDVPLALILDGRMLPSPDGFRPSDWPFLRAVSMHEALLDGPTPARCAQAGLQTLVWTVNDDDALARAFTRGLTAVITDRPAAAAALR